MDFQQLSGVERGALLGALLAGEAAESRLSRLRSQRCQRACAAMQQLDRGQRLRRIHQLMSQALSPLPEGIERVHPSWIEQLLDGESDAVAALVVSAMPSPLAARLDRGHGPVAASPTVRWRICQRVLAPLKPMILADEQLLDWSEHRICRALIHLGCATLALVARRAGAPIVEQLANRLEAPFGDLLRQAARRPPSWAPIPRSSTLPGEDRRTPERLLQIGSQALAAKADATTCRVIAQRLPFDGLAARDLARHFGGEGDAALLLAADRWASDLQPEGATG